MRLHSLATPLVVAKENLCIGFHNINEFCYPDLTVYFERFTAD